MNYLKNKQVIVSIVLFILLVLFFYNWGVFYTSYKKGIVDDEPFMRITVMIISSLITVLAMIVALFKEDIRGLFVRPKLNLSKENNLKENTHQAGKNNIEAINYYYKILVHNVGNIPAKEVEIYLNHLKYKKNDSQIFKEIEVDGIPLLWQNSESKQIMIPRNSKKSLTLFDILPPSEVSTPDQVPSNMSNQPKFKIGKNEYCVDGEISEWIMSFSIYSDNAKPISIQLSIQWNGKWESRLTEMNEIFSTKEEVKYV